MSLTSRLAAVVAAILLLAGYVGLTPAAQRAAEAARRPGPLETGATLLPNGWRIAPAGRHLAVGDLPLAFTPSPDGRFLVVTNNGYAKPSLTVVDTASFTVKSSFPLEFAWLGLAWHPDGVRLYSTGRDSVQELVFWNGDLTATRTFALPKSATSLGGGLVVSRDGKTLFVIRALEQALVAIDLRTGAITKTVDLPAEGYTVVSSPDGARLFVSLWGGAKVLAFDAATLAPAGEAVVGEHPNAMALSANDSRLFVACANTNTVWVVDAVTLAAREQISVSLYPKAPAGSTPNAVAVAPDGRTLLVANADNNAVAVVDVSKPGASQVSGFIPAGWYPTGVGFDPLGKQVYVLSGKGLQSKANPSGPTPALGPERSVHRRPVDGRALRSAVPGRRDPRGHDQAGVPAHPLLRRDAPGAGRRAESARPFRGRWANSSPIKHVFYIIRENRTYDQVLGDVKAGNGDPVAVPLR